VEALTFLSERTVDSIDSRSRRSFKSVSVLFTDLQEKGRIPMATKISFCQRGRPSQNPAR
jgi:3-mercaptopyruvate sulfurtransferase SseA